MQEIVLNLYSEGKLSAESVVMAMLIDKEGKIHESDLAKKLRKSIRSIYRYIKELLPTGLIIRQGYYFLSALSNLSLVSFNINTNLLTDKNNSIDKDIVLSCQDKNDIDDSIDSILAKYDKSEISSIVKNVIYKTLQDTKLEYNPEALEYIIEYCIHEYQNPGKRRIRNQEPIRNFTKYFLSCIPKMWGEAITESKIKEEYEREIKRYTNIINHPELVKDPELPPADNNALKIWEDALNEIAEFVTVPILEGWIKPCVPVSLKDNTITVLSPCQTNIDIIFSRYKQQIEQVFHKKGLSLIFKAKSI